MSSSDSSKIRDISNRAHRESLVNKAIMDKHIGHTKYRDSKSSTKAEARQKAFVEETIGKKGYGWYCIYDCKYIIQFKWSFSCSVVGLMHVPQRSMPESFVCPSCPKLHAHSSTH
uniref:Uncharacterized protein n=1 Tax=Opuntia streptacantha TaxID=393608 RepID=A0A7C8YGB5_OPUST